MSQRIGNTVGTTDLGEPALVQDADGAYALPALDDEGRLIVAATIIEAEEDEDTVPTVSLEDVQATLNERFDEFCSLMRRVVFGLETLLDREIPDPE